MPHLTFDPIDPQSFLAPGDGYHRGASVLFLGIVRDHSEQRPVRFLEYEAYETMAENLLERLILSAKSRWAVTVRLQHRLGRVHLGEIAVAIEVSAAHRDEAYRASRFLIDEIKHQVPIWKKEFFADGSSQWSLCTHATASASPGLEPAHEHPHV